MADDSTIPVVDFQVFSSPSPSDHVYQTSKLLTSALHTHGIVALINHPLASTSLAAAFHRARSFFSLPSSTKLQAPHPPGYAVHRGYSPPGLEKVSQLTSSSISSEALKKLRAEISDVKESFEVGSESNSEQPNIWLPDEASSLPGFKNDSLRFYWECDHLAKTILRSVAIGLDMPDPDFFVQRCTGLNNQLRILHYPPIAAGEVDQGAMTRMPAHSDWSAITLLFQDDCGGLEVEDPISPDSFIPVTPIEGACLVNVGDLLMRWSNDYLKSPLHRVALPQLSDRFEGEERMTRQRYSIPYFVGPDPDVLVECLPSCSSTSNPAKYEPITQRAYNAMRGCTHYESSEEAT
ncbi:Clavaminate synthase-like protein [Polychaeton citri CBS 116435]|uniref:Clavaminate synthase-like protein n=1 Tax=Polychaeton citri CBS 116435 TaxID=1314669 RepID=A0A9P4QDD2_9PEZI|nr:Clavaminate synthase-like protein [Polychaeton citri CBS 116435]